MFVKLNFQPSANQPIQQITEFALFRENVENKVLRHKRNDEIENVNNDNYNSGLQYSAYGEAGTGRSAGPTRKPQGNKKSGPRSTQRPELAPQIDEDFVSQLFKHPEAVKYVYDFLEEKKSQTSTTKAPRWKFNIKLGQSAEFRVPICEKSPNINISRHLARGQFKSQPT